MPFDDGGGGAEGIAADATQTGAGLELLDMEVVEDDVAVAYDAEGQGEEGGVGNCAGVEFVACPSGVGAGAEGGEGGGVARGGQYAIFGMCTSKVDACPEADEQFVGGCLDDGQGGYSVVVG